jgi:hypothetical protein
MLVSVAPRPGRSNALDSRSMFPHRPTNCQRPLPNMAAAGVGPVLERGRVWYAGSLAGLRSPSVTTTDARRRRVLSAARPPRNPSPRRFGCLSQARQVLPQRGYGLRRLLSAATPTWKSREPAAGADGGRRGGRRLRRTQRPGGAVMPPAVPVAAPSKVAHLQAITARDSDSREGFQNYSSPGRRGVHRRESQFWNPSGWPPER